MRNLPAFTLVAVALLVSCKQQAPVAAVPATSTSTSAPEAKPHVAGSALAATPRYREFKDFVVGCDNTASCTAIAAPRDVQNGLYLSLQRDAGADGAITLQVADGGNDGLKASDLTIDMKPAPAISGLAWKDDGQGSLTLTDPLLVRQFLTAVKDATRLHKGTDQDDYLSLAGLEASLLFIDETQGRVDNVTALGKPGLQSAAVVPAAAPAPVLPPAYAPAPTELSEMDSDRLARKARLQAGADLKKAHCEYTPGPDSLGDPDGATALTATQALVFVTCNGGPYQSEVLAYLMPREGNGNAARLVLPAIPFKVGTEGAITFDTLVGADYNAATATLSYDNKGRGLSDCGDWVTWRFDGKDFALVSVSSLDRCAGAVSDYWPVYWRTAK